VHQHHNQQPASAEPERVFECEHDCGFEHTKCVPGTDCTAVVLLVLLPVLSLLPLRLWLRLTPPPCCRRSLRLVETHETGCRKKQKQKQKPPPPAAKNADTPERQEAASVLSSLSRSGGGDSNTPRGGSGGGRAKTMLLREADAISQRQNGSAGGGGGGLVLSDSSSSSLTPALSAHPGQAAHNAKPAARSRKAAAQTAKPKSKQKPKVKPKAKPKAKKPKASTKASTKASAKASPKAKSAAPSSGAPSSGLWEGQGQNRRWVGAVEARSRKLSKLTQRPKTSKPALVPVPAPVPVPARSVPPPPSISPAVTSGHAAFGHAAFGRGSSSSELSLTCSGTTVRKNFRGYGGPTPPPRLLPAPARSSDFHRFFVRQASFRLHELCCICFF